ncbi:hypothetical protein SAMN05421770_105115 [Granulicella rosea]|uniref:Uncharacterized protein n=1 Tax=Granulicella rosea TaxID=474952 RepID=A0A239KPG3_9BACT|nr:hypothetical protein [Granulicella rosea]SNT20061.1 hypothetical protein SAMN05421770_105115 [Granulicella rosea]
MIRQTAIALVLAATAALAPTTATAAPLANLLHLHPHTAAQQDARVSFYLHNNGYQYAEFVVDGKAYPLQPNASVAVKALPGTVVYTRTNLLVRKRGDAILTVDPKVQGARINLN